MTTPENFADSLPLRDLSDIWEDIYRAVTERGVASRSFFTTLRLSAATTVPYVFGILFSEIGTISAKYLVDPSGINPESYRHGEFKYCNLITCLQGAGNAALPPPSPFDRSPWRVVYRRWPFREYRYETLAPSRLKRQRTSEYFLLAAKMLHTLRYYSLDRGSILRIPDFIAPGSTADVYFIQQDKSSCAESEKFYLDHVFHGYLAPGRYSPSDFGIVQKPDCPFCDLAGYIDLAGSLEYFDPSENTGDSR